VSHAAAFRRDLQAAFKAAHAARVQEAPTPPTETPDGVQQPPSARWRELFEETGFTLPVDFHSWRRAYAQALADADVNAQQAAALAGHADLGAHMRYLRNAGKLRRLPESALPQLVIAPAVVHAAGAGRNGHSGKGRVPDSAALSPWPLRTGASNDTDLDAGSPLPLASGAEGHAFESHTACRSSFGARRRGRRIDARAVQLGGLRRTRRAVRAGRARRGGLAAAGAYRPRPNSGAGAPFRAAPCALVRSAAPGSGWPG
jgi:hypothetical protein